MRKITAFLAIVACFYSPFRFGLIMMEEASRSARKTVELFEIQKTPNDNTQFKKIVAPGKYLRRPFFSKDKNFVLIPEPESGVRLWTKLSHSFFSRDLSYHPFFSYLRAPPVVL